MRITLHKDKNLGVAHSIARGAQLPLEPSLNDVVLTLTANNLFIYLVLCCQLVLQLVLGFANVKDIPLNMQECLTKAIRKRYNYPRRHLDLSDFHRDPGEDNHFLFHIKLPSHIQPSI